MKDIRIKECNKENWKKVNHQWKPQTKQALEDVTRPGSPQKKNKDTRHQYQITSQKKKELEIDCKGKLQTKQAIEDITGNLKRKNKEGRH